MYDCVFKFVLVIRVKDYTVFIHETHHWSNPTRTSQEVYYDIKKPVLNISYSNFIRFLPQAIIPE